MFGPAASPPTTHSGSAKSCGGAAITRRFSPSEISGSTWRIGSLSASPGKRAPISPSPRAPMRSMSRRAGRGTAGQSSTCRPACLRRSRETARWSGQVQGRRGRDGTASARPHRGGRARSHHQHRRGSHRGNPASCSTAWEPPRRSCYSPIGRSSTTCAGRLPAGLVWIGLPHYLCCGLTTSGGAVEWFRAQMGGAAYETLIAAAEKPPRQPRGYVSCRSSGAAISLIPIPMPGAASSASPAIARGALVPQRSRGRGDDIRLAVEY